MTAETVQPPPLTEDTKAIVWQIFSVGASPLTRRSSYDAIEPVVRKRLSSKDVAPSIAVIREWFDSYDDQHWLKSEMQEAVAVMILEGVGTPCDEAKVWAVGSIDAEMAIPLVRSIWSCRQIDSLVEAALDALGKLCNRDNVLDASRLARFYSADRRIARQAIEREGRLETFRQLDTHGLDLVHQALHPAAGNLLALIVELRPQRFESLIERLDHPVMQARAAHYMVSAARHLDIRAIVRWIDHDSCDGLIALAIVHTLNTVNRLDHDLHLADHFDADHYTPSTHLRPPQDDLDAAAASLLQGLVDQLALLDPGACARWTGELLSGATFVLHRHHDHEIPLRVAQLEKACTDLCVRLIRTSWSDNLLPELIAGLRLTPRMSWTRHLAEIAWELRDSEPERAAEISRTTLIEHEGQITAELERGHVILEWQEWDHREWLTCLGIALAMSCEEVDLPNWVRTRCRSLPLSVWDAEEDYRAFSSADRVVQHRFLIALHAIPILEKLGRPSDPAMVLALAETLWAHCSFAASHLHDGADAQIAVEYAARYAVEYGAPTDSWLLDQVRDLRLSPRTLWALIDQRNKKNSRTGGNDTAKDDFVVNELACIASDRFGDGSEFNLEALHFWGLLWLLLGAADEAEKTATAILAFPMRPHERAYKILALKLLAKVAGSRRLSRVLAEFTASVYRQLWPGYAPHEERSDRQQVDEMLGKIDVPHSLSQPSWNLEAERQSSWKKRVSGFNRPLQSRIHVLAAHKANSYVNLIFEAQIATVCWCAYRRAVSTVL